MSDLIISPLAERLLAFREGTRFPGASCAQCRGDFRGAHLCLIKTVDREGFMFWQSKYPVGCSHTEFDGTPWCDNCCFAVNLAGVVEIVCSECANVEWGTPQSRGTQFYCPDWAGLDDELVVAHHVDELEAQFAEGEAQFAEGVGLSPDCSEFTAGITQVDAFLDAPGNGLPPLERARLRERLLALSH